MAPQRSKLDRAHHQTREHLIGLHRKVDEALEGALRALAGADVALAEEVTRGDRAIDELRHRVEDECLHFIARQQPVASDLRGLMGDVHVANELERIGDHAKSVAQIVSRGQIAAGLTGIKEVEEMGAIARAMLAAAVEAYLEADVDGARSVAVQDNRLDRLEQELVDDWIEHLCDRPDERYGRVHLLWIEHYLERVGDRATNIAEQAIFLVTGQVEELNP